MAGARRRRLSVKPTGTGTVGRMCGRYVSVSSPTILAERFDVDEVRHRRELEPNYNVAPRAEVPVVAESRGQRVLDRGALGPGAVVGEGPLDRRPHDQRPRPRRSRRATRTSARSNGAGASSPPTASTSGRRSRGSEAEAAVVHPPPRRRAARVRRAVGDLARPEASATTRRACVRARSSRPTPNELLAPIHDRMPVVLPESEWDTWLDRREPRRRRAAAAARARRRPTSSRRGRCRRS